MLPVLLLRSFCQPSLEARLIVLDSPEGARSVGIGQDQSFGVCGDAFTITRARAGARARAMTTNSGKSITTLSCVARIMCR